MQYLTNFNFVNNVLISSFITIAMEKVFLYN